MAESPLFTYYYGTVVGFMVGFFFLYVTMDLIVVRDVAGAMFWLGLFIMLTLFLGYMIHVDGRKK